MMKSFGAQPFLFPMPVLMIATYSEDGQVNVMNMAWVGICGELGADLELTETFMAIGVDELSVTPRAVLPLRNKIRSLDIDSVREKILAEIDGDTSPKF